MESLILFDLIIIIFSDRTRKQVSRRVILLLDLIRSTAVVLLLLDLARRSFIISSVADPDPGSGAFLTAGSGAFLTPGSGAFLTPGSGIPNPYL